MIIKILNINSNWKESVSENWRNKDIFQKPKFKNCFTLKKLYPDNCFNIYKITK